MTVGILILAALIGLIPAFIVRGKGRSFFGWWFFGAALFIVALPLALLAKDLRPRCPECAEVVQATAKVCPHCQRDLPTRIGERWWRFDADGNRTWFEPGIGWHVYHEEETGLGQDP